MVLKRSSPKACSLAYARHMLAHSTISALERGSNGCAAVAFISLEPAYHNDMLLRHIHQE